MLVDRKIRISVDENLCDGCGLCISVCPSETISIKNKKAVITGDTSLSCGHCIAICPKDAVSFNTDEYSSLQFETFDYSRKWTGYGKSDISDLTNLMLSRRSCRNFKEEDVKESEIRDLIKIGTTAPSGSNCQEWTFTVIPTKKEVKVFGEKIGNFFKKLNRMSKNPLLRNGLAFFGNSKLKFYYENYYETVKETITLYEKEGIDRLFHGATGVIMVGGRKDSSCPSEDALLATQNILLGAHAMGIGTCLIGFAVSAIENDTDLKKLIGLDENEEIYSVIALGYPNEKYRGLTVRRNVTPRYLNLK